MTDNRTTELLCRLLEERGVEYRETMSGNPAWMDSNGEEVVVLRSEAGLVQIRAWMTPEQSIAATLGMQHETDDYFYLPKLKESCVEFNDGLDFEDMDGGVKMTRTCDVSDAAIRAWGEQLDRRLMERVCEVFGSELRRGKCKMEYQEDGMQKGWFRCSACGEASDMIGAWSRMRNGEKPMNCCPYCKAEAEL